MELNLNKINGTNSFLNYDLFKESILSELNIDCDEAEVLILNNFPVPVLSQATLDFIIFLKIPKHPLKRPIIKNEEGFVYISNLIIAVSIIKEYEYSTINIDKNQLYVDDSLIDLSDNASKLKWGLTNYLHEACGLLEREKITVHPIFWVINNNQTNICENIIISKNLTFDSIKKCISINSYLRYPGYSDWNNTNFYEELIKRILEQAALDSDLGYITKKKIDRFQNRFDEASNKAFENIGKKLVEIRGKAGSGKSSDLLKCMLNKSLNGTKGTFLTYNHLLVFEISKQILGFNHSLNEEILKQKATTTTYTIHSFIYNICKKLGIILLMSNSRIEELKNTLFHRLNLIENHILNLLLIKESYSNNQLINEFQNSNKFDNGTKIEAVDFIKSNILRVFDTNTNLNSLIEHYKKNKIKKLEEQINLDFYLSDYTNVLKKTLEALDNLDVFFNEYDIENKFDLLENTLKLDDSILVIKNGNKKIDLDLLKKRYQKSINAFSSKRTLYIDEAQDCHPYERDIFFSLFGPENIVIANGGKEQLIRYDSVCSWDISKGIKIDNYIYQKRRKSYRMKPAIAALANHIAFTFKIDLNIEPLDSDDHGTILIDRSHTSNFEKKIKIINDLLNAGSRQGCSSYESLLLLKNAREQNSQNNNIGTNNNILINEYDVIRLNQANVRSEWNLIESAKNNVNDARFWNATGNVDKRKQSVPGSLSIRAIYYESSRGLESWSTMCFDIYGFFESKRNENEADNFLLNEIMDPEHRKNKYAATWVLMALTRSIDTCYLELSDKKNALTDSIENFINKNPKYVKFA
jgi:hypothetical protein